jgi:hypothetical protein
MGKTGLVPEDCVETRGTDNLGNGSVYKVNDRLTTLNSHQATQSTHLSYEKGDTIIVAEKFPTGFIDSWFCNKYSIQIFVGWWRGRLEKTGEIGLFHISETVPFGDTAIEELLDAQIAEGRKNALEGRKQKELAERRTDMVSPSSTQKHPLLGLTNSNSLNKKDTGPFTPINKKVKNKLVSNRFIQVHKAVVMFDWNADEPYQLGIQAGEELVILGKLDLGWLQVY